MYVWSRCSHLLTLPCSLLSSSSLCCPGDFCVSVSASVVTFWCASPSSSLGLMNKWDCASFAIRTWLPILLNTPALNPVKHLDKILKSLYALSTVVMGKSIRMDSAGRIDSRCRIVMKKSIQYHSYEYNALATCITVLQDRVMTGIAAMSLLASAKAISSSIAMLAGQSWLRWTGPAASGPESRTPGVDSGVLTEQWIESNWINLFATLNRIKLFSFLPNRPSLMSSNFKNAK